MTAAARRIVVLGGGISGLAAAHRLIELAPGAGVRLFEAAPRLGGVLQTDRVGPLLVEQAADMLITNTPWAVELCRRVGMADVLQGTLPGDRHVHVLRAGKLLAAPAGFQLMAPTDWRALLATRLLTPWGKLRMAAEWFLPPRRTSADEDESLADFVRRRFGREAFDRLIQPMISGIYTADPERLSARATLSRFVELEQSCGSIIRGLRRQAKAQGAEGASGARYGLFVAPADGMASLVARLAERLPSGCVQLNRHVQRLEPLPGERWAVHAAASDNPSRIDVEQADAVIVALPAPAAARVMQVDLPELAERLAAIEYASVCIVAQAWPKSRLTRFPGGFGIVIPEVERRRILAVSFSSQKFAHRAPEDQVLVRVFVGGALHPEHLALDDTALEELVQHELRDLIGADGAPAWSRVYRWASAMPQYHVGHLRRVAEIETCVQRFTTLAFAGNAYRGVGIPDCIRSGAEAAERVSQALTVP